MSGPTLSNQQLSQESSNDTAAQLQELRAEMERLRWELYVATMTPEERWQYEKGSDPYSCSW